MTLKTTKEQRDALLIKIDDPDFTVYNSVVRDLCHDADRARELEKQLDTAWENNKIIDKSRIEEMAKRDTLTAELAELRVKLDEALNRMDRARDILIKGTPTRECNWGVLDTADLRALKEQEKL